MQLEEDTRPGALCACVCTCARMPSYLISSVSKPPALRGPARLFILSRGGWVLRAAQRRAQGQAPGETRSRGVQALVSQEWGRTSPSPSCPRGRPRVAELLGHPSSGTGRS